MKTEFRVKISHFLEAEIERTLIKETGKMIGFLIGHFKVIFVTSIYS